MRDWLDLLAALLRAAAALVGLLAECRRNKKKVR